jgi:hypothetical protein
LLPDTHHQWQAEPAIADDLGIMLEAFRLTEILIIGQGDDQEEANALAVRDQGGLDLINFGLGIYSYHTEILNISSRLLPKLNTVAATQQVEAGVKSAAAADKAGDVAVLRKSMRRLANQMVSEDVRTDLAAVQTVAFDVIATLAGMAPSILQLEALTASLQVLGRLTRLVEDPAVLTPAVPKLAELLNGGGGAKLSVSARWVTD